MMDAIPNVMIFNEKIGDRTLLEIFRAEKAGGSQLPTHQLLAGLTQE